MHPRNIFKDPDSKFKISLFGTMIFFSLISCLINFLYIEINLSSLSSLFLLLLAYSNILSICVWIEWFISNKYTDSKLLSMYLTYILVPFNLIYSVRISIDTMNPDLELLRHVLFFVHILVISFSLAATIMAFAVFFNYFGSIRKLWGQMYQGLR